MSETTTADQIDDLKCEEGVFIWNSRRFVYMENDPTLHSIHR